MRPPPTGIPPARDIVEPEDVALVVRRFYQASIPDPMLGPLFRAAGIDWGVHVPVLVRFWQLELLHKEGYSGNPVSGHLSALAAAPFGERELARWVELFQETVDEDFAGPVAELAKLRATQVAAAVASLARRRLEHLVTA